LFFCCHVSKIYLPAKIRNISLSCKFLGDFFCGFFKIGTDYTDFKAFALTGRKADCAYTQGVTLG